jgi:hypothetical protein
MSDKLKIMEKLTTGSLTAPVSPVVVSASESEIFALDALLFGALEKIPDKHDIGRGYFDQSRRDRVSS